MAGLVEHLKILLTAESTQFAKEFDKAGKKVSEFDRRTEQAAKAVERNMKRAERAVKKLAGDIKEVATVMGFAGAAIAGFGALMVNEAAKYDTSVGGAVRNLKSAYSNLAVEIGRALLPVIQILARALGALVGWFQSLSPRAKQVAASLTAAAAAMMLLGSGSLGLVATLMKLAPTLLPILPILLAVVAALSVVAAGVALLRVAWEENWDGMRGETSEGMTELREGWGDFFKWVGPGLKAFGDLIWFYMIKPIEEALLAMQALVGFFKKNVSSDNAKKGLGGLEKLLGGAAKVARKVSTDGPAKTFTNVGKGFELLGKDLAKGFKGEFKDNTKPGFSAFVEKFQNPNMAGINAQAPLIDFKAPQSATFQGPTQNRIGGTTAARPELGALLDAKAELEVTAAKRIAAAMDIAATSAAAFGKGVTRVALDVIARMGGIGEVASGAIDKLASGDFWGAIAGVIGDLISAAPDFEKVVNTAIGALRTVAAALNPLMPAIQRLVAAVGMVLGVILDSFAPVFEALGDVLKNIAPMFKIMAVSFVTLNPVIRLLSTVLGILAPAFIALFDIMKFVTTVILTLVTEAAKVFNSVLQALNAFGVFDGLIAEVNTFITENQKAVDELNRTTFETATAEIDAAAAAYEFAGALGEGAASIQEITESLSNVPAGYKVNAARFAADGAGTFGPDIMSDRTKLNPNILVTVNVGGKEVAAEVETQMSYRAFQRTGGVLGPFGRR